MSIAWGTSHFVSVDRAMRYYNTYSPGFGQYSVNRKLAEGEIHIGPPEVKEGQSLSINAEGRYVITEHEK